MPEPRAPFLELCVWPERTSPGEARGEGRRGRGKGARRFYFFAAFAKPENAEK